MSDLINRRVAIKAIADLPSCYNGFTDAYDKSYIIGVLEEQPTVEALPVRHGKWISNSPVTMRCNQCTYVVSDWIVHEFHYCPNCGARMDEDE